MHKQLNKRNTQLMKEDQKEARMTKVVTLILIAVIVVVMLVSGCAQPSAAPVPPTSAPTTKTLDIGIATPLTGGSAYLGEHIKNAVIMAIDDQNEQGGVTIAGEKYKLNAIVRDTKEDAAI